jgi:amino acid transporter
LIFGAPADVHNPRTYHNLTLIALLAWVGLGADGLSSSAYGPDEAFRALGQHHFLAIALALATALTVFIISSAYRGIIDRFPFGGGGYVVASQLLGPRWGVLSGCALLVDYVLTISVSIASCADQFFSVLPPAWHGAKVPVEALIIGLLVVMNLRGVKESILVLTPIFGMFLLTHLVLILGGIFSHAGQFPSVVKEIHTGYQTGMSTLGLLGVLGLFLRAYSMGAGTFTGIEAVSNGLQIMRDPKVQTGKRTMLYMSISLAATAAGILVCYLLFRVQPVEGKTMNYSLLMEFAGSWRLGSWQIGHWYIVLTLAAEAALLFVAAQAGFIDGPRVMANMALDGWLPRRFTQLSDRLTMQDGVLLIGGAALLVLFYTHGNITALVTMYSINVFLTFSLSMVGMCRYWWKERMEGSRWRKAFAVQATGLVLCASILTMVIIEKFSHGAWITVVVTMVLVGLCLLIHRHYKEVRVGIGQFDQILDVMPGAAVETPNAPDPKQPTAVMLVGAFSGLGVHQLLQIQRMFPGHFRNFVFVSVGVIDSAAIKGVEEVEHTRERTEGALRQYVDLAQRLGFAAEYRLGIATEAVEESVRICDELRREYKSPLFFMGKLIFEHETWFHRFLHNETAYQLQRRMHFAGLSAIVLTTRLLSNTPQEAPVPIAVMSAGG